MSNPQKAEKPAQNPTFSDYWHNNIPVIPINAQGIPPFKWGKIHDEKWAPTENDLFEWGLDEDYGFALVCGEVSGIVALDLDNVTDTEIERVKKAFGSTCGKVGSKGITLFYRYSGELNHNFIKDGVIKAELLANKRLTTLPPSKHRSKPINYTWAGTPLFAATLSSLPNNYQSILNSIFSITPTPEREYIRADYDKPPTFDEAVDALNACNPNCSNEDWVRIGMAFRAEVGDAGFIEFDKWSSTGKTYDAGSIRSRWRSFNSRSINYGTLVHYAQTMGGYKTPKTQHAPTISISIDNWTARKLENYAKDVQESATLPDFYTNAPHHVKLICEWITSTARYPQPIITLGATLSFLGFYMGRDFVYKGIRGNLYNINLARSTHGKEHIIKCLRGLMRALDMDKLVGGSGATSDTAIFARLQQNNGQCVYLIDEFQAFMKVLSNKHSGNSREAGLTSLLLKAYTSRMISSVDYADPSERETITIHNPFINLITFCTPEPFFAAVSSTEAFNGLVGRLTIFEGAKILPQRNRTPQDDADLHVPADIVRILKDIKANRTRVQHDDGAFSYAPTTEVQETSEAHTLIEGINDEIDDKRREYDKEQSQMSLVIGRIFETMKKYALISSRGKPITPTDIQWAKAVADYNIGIMLKAAESITDSDFERKKMHVLEFIVRRGGYITKSDFTNSCRVFTHRKEREDVVQDLIDSGRLQVVSVDSGTKPATGYKVTA